MTWTVVSLVVSVLAVLVAAYFFRWVKTCLLPGENNAYRSVDP